MRSIHRVRGIVIAFALTSCSDGNAKGTPVGPPARVPASIVITPASATLRGVGSTATLTASVLAESLHRMRRRPIAET